MNQLYFISPLYYIVDPCFSNPCVNEGTCTTFPDSIINNTALFNCTCHSEFFGEICEIGKKKINSSFQRFEADLNILKLSSKLKFLMNVQSFTPK